MRRLAMHFIVKTVTSFLFLDLSLFSHSCNFDTTPFNPLNYVNDWRESSGLERLRTNSYLEKAASNHSRYRTMYQTGHYERYGDRAYTGKVPSDRAIYAGYPLRYVSENIAEAPTALLGVESLMTAIYHRFGFLSYDINEIGMGKAKVRGSKNTIFTYVMGNSLLARECHRSSYRGESPYFYKICKNKKQKVSVKTKTFLDNQILRNKPKFILYPYTNAQNVPPVFYEEHPDPLPRHSMVGNPLSIEFHPRYKDKSIHISDVRLWDVKAKKSLALIPFYHRNDPHKKLKTTQFAFFPKLRLRWNALYEVRLRYKIASEVFSEDVSWRFYTKKLPNMIEVDKNHYKFSVKAKQKYTIYFKSIKRASKRRQSAQAKYAYSYYQGSTITHKMLDSMTLQVCLHGKKGDVFKIKNKATLGQQEVELVLQ